MLRWVLLLTLLVNSLLFLWYAQQYRFADAIRQPDIRPAGQKLISELSESERPSLRPRECASFVKLETEYEAESLASFLDEALIEDVMQRQSPPMQVGLRVEMPLPADSASRITLLDELAKLGWLPESRDGALVFGQFSDELASETFAKEFPAELKSRLRFKPAYSQVPTYQVDFSYLQGFEIDQKILKLVAERWPFAEIEKNHCEGVASGKLDQ
jgi:hypothetical protein